MSFAALSGRLRAGRPLIVDADTCASFRARGVAVDTPGAVGRLLREHPADVLDHYRAEIRSRVDIVCALTGDTTPRALAEVGMQHRSARMTGLAVDLALDAAAEAGKPVAVAGVLGSELVAPLAPHRLAEEIEEHAQRLATAGCELILARGQGSTVGLMQAVTAAVGTGLPTFAVLELGPDGALEGGGTLEENVAELTSAGATAILVEASAVEHAQSKLDQWLSDAVVPGVLLAAGPTAVWGFPAAEPAEDGWAAGASALDGSGARIIGGGAGTTESHTAALARRLGVLHPSLPVAPPLTGTQS